MHESFFKEGKKKKRTKGKKALFSTETKTAICQRDKVCILCDNPWHSCHHAYYSDQANRSDNRNEVNQWVLLCLECHLKAHSCASGKWEREKCILYLNNYYENNITVRT